MSNANNYGMPLSHYLHHSSLEDTRWQPLGDPPHQLLLPSTSAVGAPFLRTYISNSQAPPHAASHAFPSAATHLNTMLLYSSFLTISSPSKHLAHKVRELFLQNKKILPSSIILALILPLHQYLSDKPTP